MVLCMVPSVTRWLRWGRSFVPSYLMLPSRSSSVPVNFSIESTSVSCNFSPAQNKPVIDRRLRPRCCHLGSYFKRPKSSPVRPLAWDWYYCAQFMCTARFSWAATSSNLGFLANMTSPIMDKFAATQTKTFITIQYTCIRDLWQTDRQTDTGPVRYRPSAAL